MLFRIPTASATLLLLGSLLAVPAQGADPRADAAAAARAQQAEINRRNEAAAAAARAQQAEVNRRNAAAAEAARNQQAAINRRNAEAAARAATAARNGRPAEQPRQIIPKKDPEKQLRDAARGPDEAAKVFDGRRR